ncbi:halo-CC-star protein HcsS [Haladaptatus sp. DYF46]|uniref:halo-CC-star protein HcsS n=1 Tax=Haladaptatus sp. DYF46 TaxID=2886041 RepID=UPI001E587D1E|nr:halo-CC-star protein HcsS [Haladaptatus sp. DYF46]
MSSTQSDVLTAAERLGDALAETKEESNREAFDSILLECNQEIKQELGIDYGEVCSDDSCC